MLSVVVPMYNEERAIARCLLALQREVGDDDEIIVVDNNSTDRSVAIVQDLAESDRRVRLLTQSEQGLVPTRDLGVAQSRGDLIARIDADTIVGQGWARAIVDFFASAPEDVVGGSGLCSMHDMPFQAPFRALQRRLDARAAARVAEGAAMYANEIFGANQVLRQDVWRRIAATTTRRTDIMEDTDVSLAATADGSRLALIPGMGATISGRRLRSSPIGYWRYTACSPRTYAIHGRRFAAVAAWFGIQFARITQVFIWLALLRWDPEANRFRWFGRIESEPERIVP